MFENKPLDENGAAAKDYCCLLICHFLAGLIDLLGAENVIECGSVSLIIDSLVSNHLYFFL